MCKYLIRWMSSSFFLFLATPALASYMPVDGPEVEPVEAIAELPAESPPKAQAESPAGLRSESPWRLGIALGYGERTNPLVQSDDIRIGVDIDIAWFGKRWFFDNGDLGFTVADRGPATFNIVARLNSDRVFFSKTDSDYISVFDAQGGVMLQAVSVPDRDYALELGAEMLADGDWGYLQASVHRDVSSTHDGVEAYLNVGRSFRQHRWAFEPSVGMSWKSSKLNDYYWGVRDDEANHVFPAYRAGAGLNTHTRFVASYVMDQHWTFLLIAEYERLNSETTASPIVDRRDVIGAFAGFRYGF
jgi:MipA family protein